MSAPEPQPDRLGSLRVSRDARAWELRTKILGPIQVRDFDWVGARRIGGRPPECSFVSSFCCSLCPKIWPLDFLAKASFESATEVSGEYCRISLGFCCEGPISNVKWDALRTVKERSSQNPPTRCRRWPTPFLPWCCLNPRFLFVLLEPFLFRLSLTVGDVPFPRKPIYLQPVSARSKYRFRGVPA